jgi:pimeloyl-ACP methyl ester carboxylesterase
MKQDDSSGFHASRLHVSPGYWLSSSIMPTKMINNAAYFYEERGYGTSICLIHGFPLDGRIWEAQLEALSDRYRVIVPDLRGFGQTRSADSFTMDSLAGDLHALLSELGALPCVLGGLSMGGYVALAYAGKYQADLRGLMLIDTRAEADAPAGRENRNKMIELARQQGARAVAGEMFPKLICARTVQQHPEIAHKLRQIMESQSPATIELALTAMRDRQDRMADLPAITIPTLVLVGEEDEITTPTMAKNMHKSIINSILVPVPAAGHMSPMEQPDDVILAIRRFLEGIKFGV